MGIEIEYELNRAWIYGENEDDIIGETNFIVPEKWLVKLYNDRFKDKYNSFDDFVNWYEPEIEGELIYRMAVYDDVLKEDLGIVMYKYCE